MVKISIFGAKVGLNAVWFNFCVHWTLVSPNTVGHTPWSTWTRTMGMDTSNKHTCMCTAHVGLPVHVQVHVQCQCNFRHTCRLTWKRPGGNAHNFLSALFCAHVLEHACVNILKVIVENYLQMQSFWLTSYMYTPNVNKGSKLGSWIWYEFIPCFSNIENMDIPVTLSETIAANSWWDWSWIQVRTNWLNVNCREFYARRTLWTSWCLMARQVPVTSQRCTTTK